jgi:LytR cell envelope-related transcriptional attenuator
MTHLPLAFSVHHFISSVGADAGFASIIGLAILVLLYFAQARETATLRDRADDAEQRAAQLEARLSQVANAARAQAQQTAGPRPVPSPIARPLANPAAARTATPGAAAAAPAAAASVPAAPAGVGAPALTDATRMIPLPAVAASATPASAPARPAPSPAVPEPVAAQGPAPATAAGVAATAAGAAASAGAAATGASATAAGASATAVADRPAPEATGGGANGISGDTRHQALLDEPDEPLPRVQLRPGGGGARQLPPLRQPPSSRGPSRFGRGLAALLTLLGVAAVIAVLLIVTSGGGKSNPSSGNASASNAPAKHHKSRTKAFDKGAVTVTVLNGTDSGGLAASILSQLGKDGFKQGTATNAASATVTTSTVQYLQGQKAAAQQVAKALKLSTGSVSAIDPNTQSIACPQTTCNVDVVVTIGQDLVGH